MADKYTGIPFKIEHNFTEAVRMLETTMANKKYILIVSGRKKGSLIDKVIGSKAVHSIYILKSFASNPTKRPRVKYVTSFQALDQALRATLVGYTAITDPLSTDLSLPRELEGKNHVEYMVRVDPIVMNQQCVQALSEELKQQEDQLRYHKQYALSVQILLTEVRSRLSVSAHTGNQKLLENPLYETFKEYIKNSSLRSQDSATALRNTAETLSQLFELTLHYDLSPVIIEGNSPSMLNGLLHYAQEEFDVALLFQSIKNVHDRLSQGLADPLPQELSQLHIQLLAALLGIKEVQGDCGDSWKGLYLGAMLLADIDLLLKLFLDAILSPVGDFAEQFTNALMASDMRVAVVKEMWQRSKPAPRAPSLAISPQEQEAIEKATKIRTVYVFNLNGSLGGLSKDVQQKLQDYTVKEFVLTHDFEIEVLPRNTLAYVIFEPTMPKSEYCKIMNSLINNSIGCVVIIYVPPQGGFSISKRMLTSTWIVTACYCRSLQDIMQFMENKELDMMQEMLSYQEYYQDFKKTMQEVRAVSEDLRLSEPSAGEFDGGWEVLQSINTDVFSQLVQETSLGTKLTGSLHYYVYNYFRESPNSAQALLTYWQNYASLFTVTTKYMNVLDVVYAKNLLIAYTMQTNPPFYKMLNDAFRSGSPTRIAKFRSFFVMLHDLVKNEVLRRYIGTVYRGTYFNERLLATLKPGMVVHSTCFTSTSKSEHVATSFLRKTGRNVLLEIELDPRACSNVDIDAEKCSRVPQEEEVLVLPFAQFVIQRIFRYDAFTCVTLKEVVPAIDIVDIKGIDYYN